MNTAKILLSLVLVACLHTGFAQGILLKGRVTNSTQQPVGGEILITAVKDAALLKTGFFENGEVVVPGIPVANFMVKISAFGLGDTSFTVTATGDTYDFGTVVLAAVRQLGGVVVTARMPLFKKTGEGTKVNVENTMLSASTSAADVLSKSPGITVGKGTVTVFGKGDALIYLNGKPITFEIMASIPVQQIRSVEIITNPSAKYEARGRAVINIITKKLSSLEGFQGILTQNFTAARHYMNSASFNFNYRKKKLSVTGDYVLDQGTDWTVADFVKTFSYPSGKYVANTRQEENTRLTLTNNYRFGVAYQLTPKSDISVQYDGLYNRFDLGVDIRNDARTPSNVLTKLTTFNNGLTRNINNSVNLNYNYAIDTLGSTFFAGLQYSNFKTKLYDQIRESITNNGVAQPQALRVNDGNNLISLYTFQADLTKMFRKGGKLEAGARIARITNEGRIAFKSRVDTTDKWTDFPQFANNFIYTEVVPAFYLQYGITKNKWSYRAGVRTEMSDVDGFSRALNRKVIDTTYVNLFPNARIGYTASEDWSYALSYSSRINRPVYQSIDPFLWYLDSLTTVQGNPRLIPELVHSLEGSINWKSYSLRIGFSRSNNPIRGIPLVGQSGVNSIVYTSENLGHQELYNAAVDIPFTYKNFSSYNTVSVSLEKILDNRPNYVQGQFRPQLYFYTFNQWSIPRWVDLDLSGQYYSFKSNGLRKNNAFYTLSIGMAKSFYNNQLQLRLVGEDILRSFRLVGQNTLGLITTNNDSRMNTHLARLTVTYKFGKLKNSTYRNKTVNDSEYKRIRQ